MCYIGTVCTCCICICPFLMASSALDILARLFVFNDSKAARELHGRDRQIRLCIYIYIYAALNPLSNIVLDIDRRAWILTVHRYTLSCLLHALNMLLVSTIWRAYIPLRQVRADTFKIFVTLFLHHRLGFECRECVLLEQCELQ